MPNRFIARPIDAVPAAFSIATFITVLAAAPGCAHHQHAKHARDGGHPLSFLTGRWIHDDEGTVMEEIWCPPHHADGSTAGVLRWTEADGTVRMYELMSLTPVADRSIAFQLRHFGAGMQPWASETEGPFRGVVDQPDPNRIVIRGTERNGAVESITYERTGDALISTLRFSESSGREPIVIDFVKAK